LVINFAPYLFEQSAYLHFTADRRIYPRLDEIMNTGVTRWFLFYLKVETTKKLRGLWVPGVRFRPLGKDPIPASDAISNDQIYIRKLLLE